MAAHEAQAYKDPGSPEEQSRRTFLANATLGIGGVIGLVIAIPSLVSLIPESLIKPDKSFSFQYADGYFPPQPDDQFVWGIKLTPEQVETFQQKRPDLYTPTGKITYPAVVMSFVIFSSICPHLGCRYEWHPEATRFICPCHGSQFGIQGQHLAGPAPRGLDPLPFREKDGKAEVTWIQYKSQEPDRVIVAYS